MPGLERDGASLFFTDSGQGLPLLLLHGFTGSGETWSPFAGAWAAYRRIAVDHLGHGRSSVPADPARYALDRAADDLAALLDHRNVPAAAVLGYSMGGRLALRFALAYPARVAALILVSASPGLAGETARRARIAADAALAGRIEREGVPAFIDYWERLPLFATQTALPPSVRDRQRAQRLRHSAVGLANSLRGAGAGQDPPALEALSALRMPVLLIVGEEDPRYCALAAAMQARLPRSALVRVPGAGHAVHLEAPNAFAEAVARFLATLPGQR